MDLKNPSAFGLAGAIVFVVSIFLATLINPSYNHISQYLSELALNPSSAFFFNFGLIITGVLLIKFFWMLKPFFPGSKTAWFGISFGILSSIGLIGVGVYPLPMPEHDAVARMFFVFTALSILALSLANQKTKTFSAKITRFGILVGIAHPIGLILGYSPLIQKGIIVLYGIWIVLVCLETKRTEK